MSSTMMMANHVRSYACMNYALVDLFIGEPLYASALSSGCQLIILWSNCVTSHMQSSAVFVDQNSTAINQPS